MDTPLDPSRYALFRRWAVLLDSAFAIPGLGVRVGLDPILGLIPGVGDLTTPVFTLLLVATGLRMRVPFVVLARMVLNAGVDALFGLVPVVGDFVDFGWKANLKNLELLERHTVPGTPASPADARFVAVGLALLLLVGCLALLPIVIAAWVIAWVIAQRGLI
jgi:hypothetical protein